MTQDGERNVKKTILLVHVGPVQDFIKSARRCRDLWYGSKLLSEASRAVATALVAASGQTLDALVFPGRLHPRSGDGVSVANKIQITIDGCEREQIKSIAEAGRAGLSAFLEGIANERFDDIDDALERLRLSSRSTSYFDREMATNQVAELMEMFWVAIPFTEDTYPEARRRAESLLAARKNTRNWNAAPDIGFGIPKSALDGVRESVISEDVFRDNGEFKDWMRYRVFGVRAGERLCGVGLLKRTGDPPGEEMSEDVPPFHSTSHMASGPLRHRIARYGTENWHALRQVLEAQLGSAHIKNYRAKLPESIYEASDPRVDASTPINVPHALPADNNVWGYDGLLLYPHRVDTTGPGSLLSDLDLTNEQRKHASRAIQSAQRDLLSALRVSEPHAYYAVLLADGDRMGRAIDALGSEPSHREFSRELDEAFASRCDEVVINHGGSLIYSGGDDVLAILPLHTALQCAEALNALFDDAMRAIFKDKDGIQTPTLSLGMAIAHHMEPFGEVRQQASEAEQLAKRSGRARLAISVRKRGNATLSVVGPWKSGEAQVLTLTNRLRRWATVLSTGGLPSSLAYKLEDAVTPLRAELSGGHGSLDDSALESMCRALLRGVLDRRALGEDVEEEISNRITALFDDRLRAARDRPGVVEPFAIRAILDMAHELRIASTFNDAWEMAFGDIVRESGDRI